MNINVNKIIESFNKLNDQARYGVLAGVVVLIILLDVFLLTMPQLGSIGSMNDQMSKLAADTQQVIDDKARIVALRKSLEDTRGQFGVLNRRVRPIQEVPAILSTISSIANEYSVKIDQLTPEKSQQEDIKSSLQGKYYALPIVIKTRCGYHMFGRFLSKLEAQDLYFIVSDFIIQNDALNPNTHLFSLTIKVILVDHAPPAKNL